MKLLIIIIKSFSHFPLRKSNFLTLPPSSFLEHIAVSHFPWSKNGHALVAWRVCLTGGDPWSNNGHALVAWRVYLAGGDGHALVAWRVCLTGGDPWSTHW